MVKHINVTIEGKVQGVFFRASAKEEAVRLGVRGFVRNLADGRVYLEAEGPGEVLDHLIAWCRRGPAKAVVTEVRTEHGELRNFTTFEIRR